MQIRSTILYSCLLISAGSLGLGYILAGYWMILVVFPLMVLIWGYSYKHSVYWVSSILMLLHIVLTAIGVIADLSKILMVISGTTALLWWDLLQLKQNTDGLLSGENSGGFEKFHLKSLVVTAAVGLLLALFSANRSSQFPFGVSVLLILSALGGLIYSMQYIMNAKD